MSAFGALLLRTDDKWRVEEAYLDEFESVDDVVDFITDFEADVRLLLIEDSDAYAVLVRFDLDHTQAQIFLTDSNAAAEYPLAAMFAEEVEEVAFDSLDEDSEDDYDDDEDADEDAEVPLVLANDSAPSGDAALVADLGVPAERLVELSTKVGMLPMDVLEAVCEQVGCSEEFESVRG